MYLVPCLSVLSLLMCGAASRCVMYGNCGEDEETEKPIPCAINRDPVRPDEFSLELLNKMCPDLTKDAVRSGVCCSSEQLQQLAEEVQQAEALGLASCPGCYRNFMNIFCHLVCSSGQSESAYVNETRTVEGGVVVKRMTYVLSERFARTSYEICKDVPSVITGTTVMQLMCGDHGPDCSPERWLHFLGAPAEEGGYSPMKTDYIISDSEVEVQGAKLLGVDVEPSSEC